MAQVNKVILNGETLIDLTGDTITPDAVLTGRQFHQADGNIVEGIVAIEEREDPIVGEDGNNWIVIEPSGPNTYMSSVKVTISNKFSNLPEWPDGQMLEVTDIESNDEE